MSSVFSYRRGIKMPPQDAIDPRTNGIVLKGTNGITAVLIHGMTGTPNEMRFLATYLNKHGYTVICPRLAYHGESIYVLSRSTWQDFYASVRTVILNEKAEGNKGPFLLAGLSLGALLSLLAADEFRDDILAVSCLAPTLFYDGWNTPRSKYLLPLVFMTPLRYFFYFKEEPPYGIKNEAVRERVHKYYSIADLDNLENVDQYGYPFFPVSLLNELQLLVRHLGKRMGAISLPVQLIQAKDDDMTSIRNSKFIYDRVASRVKEIVLLYDSYHVITADQERYVVAEKVERFFREAVEAHDGAIAR